MNSKGIIKMENLKVVRINNGKSYHIAREVETAHVGMVWSAKCNSIGSSGRKERIYDSGREVSKENVTCKKCLKAYFG